MTGKLARKAAILFLLLGVLLCPAQAVWGSENDGSATEDDNQQIVQLQIVGSSRSTRAVPVETDGIPSHYFEVPLEYSQDGSPYATIQYEEIYPGIDVATYSRGHQIEYVFRLSTGADPDVIRLLALGVRNQMLSAGRDLLSYFEGGEIIQTRPYVEYESREESRQGDGQYWVTPAGESHVGIPADFLNDWSSVNGAKFNVVTRGGQPGGPGYSFYVTKNEVTNEDFLKFLNDAHSHTNSERGAHMFFDGEGNVRFDPNDAGSLLFNVGDSRMTYRGDRRIGERYAHQLNSAGEADAATHPVAGVSWYGSVKFCNWLTIVSKRGAAQRCYSEGMKAVDWAPVTATNWANGKFSVASRAAWLRYRGFRLPMADCTAPRVTTNSYNEFYKAAAWDGTTNRLYGYGTDLPNPLAANYTATGDVQLYGTLPAGFFNGTNFLGGVRTIGSVNMYGLEDVSGNVDEWLNDFAGDGDFHRRIAVGGSWKDDMPPLNRCRSVDAGATDGARGFRVTTTYMPRETMLVHVLYSFYMEQGGGGALDQEMELPLEFGYGEGAGAEEEEELEVAEAPVSQAEPPGDVSFSAGVEESEDISGIVYKDIPPPVITYSLSVDSVSPNAGISVSVSAEDIDGRSDGRTSFDRTYVEGTAVTLVAPASVGANIFSYWLKDGLRASDTPTVTITMERNISMMAVYTLPRRENRLTVGSINPSSGVSITLNARDVNGRRGGTTEFRRTFEDGAKVTLTAPALVGENTFVQWLRNGSPVSSSLSVTVTMSSDIRMTAEYAPPRILYVESINPASGVTITPVTTDRDGQGDGVTMFQRRYDHATFVSLTAPLTVTTNTFRRWLVNGVELTTSQTATIVMTADATLTAEYVAPRQVTVESFRPASGVSITAVSADRNGDSDGTTVFVREYDHNSIITMTAPAMYGTNTFLRWLQDGIEVATSPTLNITITDNTLLTAEYVPPRLVTVESEDPLVDVRIYNVTADINAMSDDVTVFTRSYNNLTPIGMTASYVAPDGNYFRRWLQDGVFLSTGMTINIVVDDDTTLRAVYGPPPILSFESTDPASGVSITGVSEDNNALSDGLTSFQRTYFPGSNVAATAAYSATNGYMFSEWRMDGAFLTTNRTASIVISADTTLTAVYVPPPRVTFASESPAAGVSIIGVPTDIYGQSDGSTMFSRSYYPGSNVTATAPYLAPNGNVFSSWQQDGSFLSTNRVMSITVSGDTTLTAVYRTPPVMTFDSINAGGGLDITGVTIDNNGDADGQTIFNRVYYPYSNVVATAPILATNGNIFLQWLQDGSYLTSNLTASVTIISNTTLTAEYFTPPTITFESRDPNSGVSIVGVSPDNVGATDGVTSFQRLYFPGSNITATAPDLAPNGNVFQRWLLDGVLLTSNHQASVWVTGDATLRAVYFAPILTVDSVNPAAGVGITAVSVDNLGDGDDTTVFTRVYYPGSNVTVTAPFISPAGTVFTNWLHDGVLLTTSMTASITINADTALTAVYIDAPNITFESINPVAGVDITGVTPDNSGASDGQTVFSRQYFPGSNVVATAAYVAPNGFVFDRWHRDGALLTSNRTASIVMNWDSVMTAVYVPVPVITVESELPAFGINVTGVTPDNNGDSDGATVFQRSYYPGSNMVATAPHYAGNGNVFQHWNLDGVLLSSNLTSSITVTTNATLRAIYLRAPILTVESHDPASGVAMTGVSIDNILQGDGNTVFQRVYNPGSNIVVTAPMVAPNMNYFAEWRQDGSFLTTNFTAQIPITNDTTLSAIYRDPPVVSFESANPTAGADITGVSSDIDGSSDGQTAFTRRYYPNSNVVATAEQYAPNGNIFIHWLQDGSVLSSNLQASIVIGTSDTTLTAVYVTAPILTIQSINPGSGVGITGVSVDNLGQSDGSTIFQRVYNPGSNVTATAPYLEPGGNVFDYWRQDGVHLTTNFTAAINIATNTTLTAVYRIPPTLTFASQNPGSGVDITNVTSDIDGNGDAQTMFSRRYYPNSNVTAVADSIAPDGNFFIYWLQDGSWLTSNRQVSIVMSSNTTLTAVYQLAPHLIVSSVSPNSGVSITNVSIDNLGLGDGITQFERVYFPGSNVTAEAPYLAPNGYVFEQWRRDGLFLTTSRVAVINISSDSALEAQYRPPPVVRFESLNPDFGVDITSVTVDNNSDGAGQSAFSREYYPNRDIMATAPALVSGGRYFLQWTQDGVPITNGYTVNVKVISNMTLRAEYADPAAVSFESRNPNSGVDVSVSDDNNGDGDGQTAFGRVYMPGSNIFATVAYVAPGGNIFDHWEDGGVYYTNGLTMLAAITNDRTFTAVFRAPPVVTFESGNPDSGVDFTGVTSDNNGDSDGQSTFTREYFPGSNVTATAPAFEAGGNVFIYWTQDGTIITNGYTVSITMVSNTTLKAEYETAADVTFASRDPNSGVDISVSIDNQGNADGQTTFNRLYIPMTNIFATAPDFAPGGNAFDHWESGAGYLTNGRTMTATITNDRTFTAVFRPPPVVSFESFNPASGVDFTGVTVDNNGAGDGQTTFTHEYFSGSNVFATAPNYAPGGSVFQHWLQDAVWISSNHQVSITANSNTTLTAVYADPIQLTVNSIDPASGVPMTGVSPDNEGNADGSTVFTRKYEAGSNITVTADYIAPNGNVFVEWLQDGSYFTNNRTASITIGTDTTLTARYMQPPTLNVLSAFPNSGAIITNVTPDVNGDSDGTTAFAREYYPGSNVVAVAPSVVGTNLFVRWLHDGSFLTTNLLASITIGTNDTSLTAVFSAAPVVTVRSQYPNSGVTISGVTVDAAGAGDGTTAFARTYAPGTPVVMTAPYAAPNGNVFARWLQGASLLTTNRTASITIIGDTLLTAVYIPPPMVTFTSIDPVSGVAISGVTPDINGDSDGLTVFTRIYFPGSNVVATASYSADNGGVDWVFSHWEQDGSLLTTGRTMSVSVLVDTTLTAVYDPPFLVTFASGNPASGVSISGITTDNDGMSDGTTTFQRRYFPGSNVTATAAYLAPNDNVFERWEQDGVFLSTNRAMSITVNSNTTLRAFYITPPVVRFESANPAAGVGISGVTPDKDGLSDGNTTFSRIYYPGSNVVATAPYFSTNGSFFTRWELDSAFLASNLQANITVGTNDTTLTAIYSSPDRVTFESGNPNSGVSISGVSIDNLGNSDGDSIFQRFYIPGTNITATAPYVAPNGNVFQHWVQDGVFLTPNLTLSVTVSGDTILRAVYIAPPVVRFESFNPSADVGISGVTPDNNGANDGDTAFSRIYYPGSNVVATAPVFSTNGNVFVRWERDSVYLTSNRQASITLDTNDTTVTAIFEDAVVVTFESDRPSSGVGITGVSIDNLGDTGGSTLFARRYISGTNVSATAPYLAPNGNVFHHWLQDGSFLSTGHTATVTASADTTLRAVYIAPPTVTFESSNPGTGVGITGVTPDSNGFSDAVTVFGREYYPGSNIVATAPFIETNGNVFARWELDGLFLTTNLQASITVGTNDTTLTAVYDDAIQVTFESQNPNAGVAMTGVSVDNVGASDGSTAFTRLYVQGTNVSATASYLAPNGNVFHHWLQDGTFLSAGLTVTATVSADMTLMAVYMVPPTVTFGSVNPNSGVGLSGVTIDNDAFSDGDTVFSREYLPGSNVVATAPYIATNGNVFVSWEQDGVFLMNNRQVSIVMTTNDTTLTAVYEDATMVAFESMNPAAGVLISGVSVDNVGDSDGNTLFTRLYVDGSNIVATASYIAPGGNFFDRWLQDGLYLTTNRTAAVTLAGSTTLTAVYIDPPIVSFESSNPDMGVGVTGVTPDVSGDGDGTTLMLREYYPGSNVFATADYLAPDGNVFLHWLQDGLWLTSNRQASIIMGSNTTLTAVYLTAPRVTFESENPSSGADISGVSVDNVGASDGQTQFERVYLPGSNITATAAYAASGNVFDRWEQYGILITTNRLVGITVSNDTTLTAWYVEPPIVTFASTNPVSGVPISGVTPDNNAAGDGNTTFLRVYFPGSNAVATAPHYAPNGNMFLRWSQDGALLTSNRNISIDVTNDTTVTVEYFTPPEVTFASIDPIGGVDITGVSSDNRGLSDGQTEFRRLYEPGSNITATAAYLAPNGNVFQQWEQDGGYLGTNRSIAVGITNDTTLTAVYIPPPIVQFLSDNPNSGVTITNVTMDINGDTSDDTAFSRYYYPGSNVTFEAPFISFDGNMFLRWEQDGVFLTSNLQMNITVTSNTSLRAFYETTPVLTIQSLNPGAGIDITGVSVDNLGRADGQTEFARIYLPGSNVTATAPSLTAGANTFRRWTMDGVLLTSNLTATLTITTNTTIRAEYWMAAVVTVESRKPDAGVAITNVTADNRGDTDDATSFVRYYFPGTNVTMVAGSVATNDNTFRRWEFDSVFLTSNLEVSIVASTGTLTAIYDVPPSIVTVESDTPGAGINITGVSLDQFGDTDGVTTFTRQYARDAPISMTAEFVATNGNVFQYWERDGAFMSTQRTFNITLPSDTTLEAFYLPVPLGILLAFNPTNILESDPSGTAFLTATPFGGSGTYINYDYEFVLLWHQWTTNWQPSTFTTPVNTMDWNRSIKYQVRVQDSLFTWSDWSRPAFLWVGTNGLDGPLTDSGL